MNPDADLQAEARVFSMSPGCGYRINPNIALKTSHIFAALAVYSFVHERVNINERL